MIDYKIYIYSTQVYTGFYNDVYFLLIWPNFQWPLYFFKLRKMMGLFDLDAY